MSKSSALLLCLLGFAPLAVGCNRVAATSATPESPRKIDGPTWRLTGIGAGSADAVGKAERPVTVRFETGRVDGFSGCNPFFGTYTIDGDRVTFGPLAGTMMACPPAETALESAVRGALVGTPRYAIDGDRLTVTPGSGPALVFQAEPAPALEGVTWHVSGFNNGRQAVVSPLPGTALTLRFGDGSVQGHAGCNSFRAPYTSDGDRMTVGPVVATRMACAGDGVMQQEQEFLAALETATTWTVRGGMLDVHRADGERVLTANASAE